MAQTIPFSGLLKSTIDEVSIKREIINTYNNYLVQNGGTEISHDNLEILEYGYSNAKPSGFIFCAIIRVTQV